MQFTAAFLALAAFAVSQVSANASIVRQFNALGATDQGALHTCLNNYRTDNWVRPPFSLPSHSPFVAHSDEVVFHATRTA